MQALFPQLVSNIFAPQNGWGLRQITVEANRYEFEALLSFLEPQGPMFRLCYKLLYDPQLKYNLPLNSLPVSIIKYSLYYYFSHLKINKLFSVRFADNSRKG